LLLEEPHDAGDTFLEKLSIFSSPFAKFWPETSGF